MPNDPSMPMRWKARVEEAGRLAKDFGEKKPYTITEAETRKALPLPSLGVDITKAQLKRVFDSSSREELIQRLGELNIRVKA